jgi:glyoxylase-like metal-dependent hydrolase (beta-lactamase superfamily II)
MREQLASAGIDVADIRRLVITHMHHDHYGLAAKLKNASGAEVLLHERDWSIVQPYLDDLQGTMLGIRRWIGTAGISRRRRPTCGCPARPSARSC